MFSLLLFFLLNFLTELSLLLLKSEFLWWYYILSSFFFWLFIPLLSFWCGLRTVLKRLGIFLFGPRHLTVELSISKADFDRKIWRRSHRPVTLEVVLWTGLVKKWVFCNVLWKNSHEFLTNPATILLLYRELG